MRVLDRAGLVLDALEAGAASLSVLVLRTGLPRPTAQRIALALEHRALVGRDACKRFILRQAGGQQLRRRPPIRSELRCNPPGPVARVDGRLGPAVAATGPATSLRRDCRGRRGRVGVTGDNDSRVRRTCSPRLGGPRVSPSRTRGGSLRRHRGLGHPPAWLVAIRRRARAQPRFGFRTRALTRTRSGRRSLRLRPRRETLPGTRAQAGADPWDESSHDAIAADCRRCVELGTAPWVGDERSRRVLI